MILKEITDKKKWNSFAANQPHAEFLQSWEWGEVSGLARRWALLDGEEIKAIAMVLARKIAFFEYDYCPRGPLGTDAQATQELLRQLKKQSRKCFWRLEPALSAAWSKDFWQKQAHEKTINLQPAQTLMLDLSLSEDELLAAMHQKTRYNIRLAIKKGVTVRLAKAEEAEKFWQLMQATSERDQFGIHSAAHYQKILEKGADVFKLYLAEYQGKALAAGIFAFFGDTVTYVHGASSNHERQLMAPYALHWHLLQEAKVRGYKYYDLYGIDAEKWPGVTRFKEGFGGQKYQYFGAIDLVQNLGYYKLYKLLRRIRRSL